MAFSFGGSSESDDKKKKAEANADAASHSLCGESGTILGQTASPGSASALSGDISFGAGTTGSPAFVPAGSSAVKFQPVQGSVTKVKNNVSTTVNTRHQAITSMIEYEGKSFEELRLEDEQEKRLINSILGNATGKPNKEIDPPERRAILISDIPNLQYSHARMRDRLTIHFMKKSNGGGDIDGVVYPLEGCPHTAVIIFAEQRTCTSVLWRDQYFADSKSKLAVEIFPPVFNIVEAEVNSFYWKLVPRLATSTRINGFCETFGKTNLQITGHLLEKVTCKNMIHLQQAHSAIIEATSLMSCGAQTSEERPLVRSNLGSNSSIIKSGILVKNIPYLTDDTEELNKELKKHLQLEGVCQLKTLVCPIQGNAEKAIALFESVADRERYITSSDHCFFGERLEIVKLPPVFRLITAHFEDIFATSLKHHGIEKCRTRLESSCGKDINVSETSFTGTPDQVNKATSTILDILGFSEASAIQTPPIDFGSVLTDIPAHWMWDLAAVFSASGVSFPTFSTVGGISNDIVFKLRKGYEKETEIYNEKCTVSILEAAKSHRKDCGYGELKLIQYTWTGAVAVVMVMIQLKKDSFAVTPTMVIEDSNTPECVRLSNVVDFSNGWASKGDVLDITFNNADEATEFKAKLEECKTDRQTVELAALQQMKIDGLSKENQNLKKELQEYKEQLREIGNVLHKEDKSQSCLTSTSSNFVPVNASATKQLSPEQHQEKSSSVSEPPQSNLKGGQLQQKTSAATFGTIRSPHSTASGSDPSYAASAFGETITESSASASSTTSTTTTNSTNPFASSAENPATSLFAATNSTKYVSSSTQQQHSPQPGFTFSRSAPDAVSGGTSTSSSVGSFTSTGIQGKSSSPFMSSTPFTPLFTFSAPKQRNPPEYKWQALFKSSAPKKTDSPESTWQAKAAAPTSQIIQASLEKDDNVKKLPSMGIKAATDIKTGSSCLEVFRFKSTSSAEVTASASDIFKPMSSDTEPDPPAKTSASEKSSPSQTGDPEENDMTNRKSEDKAIETIASQLPIDDPNKITTTKNKCEDVGGEVFAASLSPKDDPGGSESNDTTNGKSNDEDTEAVASPFLKDDHEGYDDTSNKSKNENSKAVASPSQQTDPQIKDTASPSPLDDPEVNDITNEKSESEDAEVVASPFPIKGDPETNNTPKNSDNDDTHAEFKDDNSAVSSTSPGVEPQANSETGTGRSVMASATCGGASLGSSREESGSESSTTASTTSSSNGCSENEETGERNDDKDDGDASNV